MCEYIDLSGDIIDYENLNNAFAYNLAKSISSGKIDFIRLVECRKITYNSLPHDVIIFDIELGLGQNLKYQINRVERIAVAISSDEDKIPEVLALRKDFPLTPHLQLSLEEFPRKLCLFSEPDANVLMYLTPTKLLFQISHWMTSTAHGVLHEQDQPLEQLLPKPNRQIIVPDIHNYSNIENKNPKLYSIIDDYDNGIETLRMIETINSRKDSEKAFVPIFLKGEPQEHGIIKSIPLNMFCLHEFLKSAGLNLVNTLRETLKSYMILENFNIIKNAGLIIITALPKKRYQEATQTESTEYIAFLIIDSIEIVGKKIGLWEIRDNKCCILIGGYDQSQEGKEINVHIANVINSLTPEFACLINGNLELLQHLNKKITLVGLGALGSQVFNNLIRSGFGVWTLIDDDIIVPHNLSRHYLSGFSVGYNKAKHMAFYANSLFDGVKVAKAITCDILNPGNYKSQIVENINDADIILDISTSIPVARRLALDYEGNGRRLSIFLNPVGTDVVILCEDKDRATKLDFIEMQYYRGLLSWDNPKEHLNSIIPVRYGTSCRDVSSIISQDNISILAGICSKSIKEIFKDDNSIIKVWKIEPENNEVTCHTIDTHSVIIKRVGDWTIKTDTYFLEKVNNIRKSKLPRETGGVIIGSFDEKRKIAYVVDTISSPKDSIERSTTYIRGCKGLTSQILEIKNITREGLNYIGEWHSHPNGAGADLSNEDRDALKWLSETMAIEGFPALMLIVEEDKYEFYIDNAEISGK